MQDPIDEEEVINEGLLFSVEDVTWDTKRSKDMHKIYLIASASDTPFNLFKYYLALKEYVFRMETELGVMDSIDEVH